MNWGRPKLRVLYECLDVEFTEVLQMVSEASLTKQLIPRIFLLLLEDTFRVPRLP